MWNDPSLLAVISRITVSWIICAVGVMGVVGFACPFKMKMWPVTVYGLCAVSVSLTLYYQPSIPFQLTFGGLGILFGLWWTFRSKKIKGR